MDLFRRLFNPSEGDPQEQPANPSSVEKKVTEIADVSTEETHPLSD